MGDAPKDTERIKSETVLGTWEQVWKQVWTHDGYECSKCGATGYDFQEMKGNCECIE